MGEAVPLLHWTGRGLMTDIQHLYMALPYPHPMDISIIKHNRIIIFLFSPNNHDLYSIIQISSKGMCPQINGIHMAKFRFIATLIFLPFKGENTLPPVLPEISMGFEVFLQA